MEVYCNAIKPERIECEVGNAELIRDPPDIPVILVNSTCMKNSMLDHNFLQVLELDRIHQK
ncbi:hypothetical protein MAR_020077 [Mya arenaria]|uniref:Uncharacterized protein n=1 Tax=Mya arenaria TaxID=6604 RepID=A0ABY7E3W7_MYAAR|nr:hypothetical protein MAR_020077 [Mya arenaria]